MPDPTIAAIENSPSLGAPTLIRKWRIFVNLGSSAAPNWTLVKGITNCTPQEEPTTQDASDYDSGGWKSTATTAYGWGYELEVTRKTASASDTYSYDPAQEALRLKGYQQSPGNQIEVMAFEWSGPTGPRVQAYQGLTSVSYSEGSGDYSALSTARLTLSGMGKRLDIAHPFGPTVWAETTDYALHQQVFGSDGAVLQAQTAGTSGATAPSSSSLSDGTVTWFVAIPA